MKVSLSSGSVKNMAWNVVSSLASEDTKAAWNNAASELKEAVDSNRSNADDLGHGWKGGKSICCAQ